jgi:ankyrin repeat protein
MPRCHRHLPALVAILVSFLLAALESRQGGQADTAALFDAVGRGDLPRVTALLDQQVSLDGPNAYGYSPLHWAVITRQAPAVDLLLTRGARADARSGNGRAPLHDAASAGDERIVRSLIQHAAAAYPTDNLGRTPLDLAVEAGHSALLPLLKPLHVAAERNDQARARQVIAQEPASVQAKDESGLTALHVAAGSGATDVARVLAEGGAGINARGGCGATPLRLAIEHNQHETAALLRSKDAADSSDDLLLRTPLQQGKAIAWYLFGTAWVVRTATHTLVFEYTPREYLALARSAHPCLGNGDIDPGQLTDQNVVVFASFLRDAAHGQALLAWRTAIPRITFVFGDNTVREPGVVFVPPRTQQRVGDMDVLAFPATGYGEGFAVTVDGLTIVYGGDHQSSDPLWTRFVREIDFLHSRLAGVDLLFLQMMFEEQMSSSRGVLYALVSLTPKLFLPNSAVADRPFYKPFVDKAAAEGLAARITSATSPGEVFFSPPTR